MISILKDQLEALSVIQRQIVDWSTGPLLVLAGPGSGKTRVLTTRIARILSETSKERFRILALTFTNRAAEEMRARVEQLAPASEARLFIGTFHSFCTEVVRQNGSVLGIATDFRIFASDREREALLAEAIRKARGSGDGDYNFDPKKLLVVVDRLKAQLIDPDGAAKHFSNLELGQQVGQTYKAYEEGLKSSNALDFNGLVFYAHKILQAYPAVASKYRTAYRYWCLDEFQDTNDSQYRVFTALAGSDFNNIFVVADDDQIIYQWNGASHSRIEQLARDLKPKVIQLPTNFRCPPQIVAIANKLIQHNFLRSAGKLPLEAAKTNESRKTVETVKLLSFKDDREEAEGTARLIAARRAASPNSSMVVLARTKALLEGVHDALRNQGINSKIMQRRDEFQSAPFIWLHACLRLCNDRDNERVLESVVGAFNQISGSEIGTASVVIEAKATQGDLLRAWSRLLRVESKNERVTSVSSAIDKLLVQGTEYRKFADFALGQYGDIREGEKDEEVFPGFDEDAKAWTSLLREIQGAVGRDASLEVFLQELDLRSKEAPIDSNAVPLMTIHASKGNEFDEVILVGLAEDVLPSYHSKKKGDRSPELEEERRNCFVAITRASELLVLSYSKSYRGWAKPPSRFLREMELIA
jgi:DNA helicase-2/ATP-dependent DNA helicase PcrA